MSYQAGDTYPASITIRDADGNPIDPETLTLTVRAPDATTTSYTYPTDSEIVNDSTGVYHADISLSTAGMWIFEWATTNEAEVERVQVSVGPALEASVTFATVAELATVLGWESLTAVQSAQGQMLLELGTGLIVEAVNRDDEWAAALNPVPRVLRAVCLAFAVRVLQNPAGASSESETLGAYSHTTRYETAGSAGVSRDLALTATERTLVRRAVFGRLSGTSMPATTFDLAVELCETGDIAGFPAT